MQRLLKTVKGTELIAGSLALVCSLWIFAPADQVDVSNSEVLSRLLLLLAPAFVVFLGCYRQAVHREAWGLLLVLIGAGWNFTIMKGVAGHNWSLRVVQLELCLLLVACVASCFHAVWDFLSLFTLRTSHE